MKFLLYCDKPVIGTNANTILDHINSFQKYSSFDFEMVSSRNGLPEDINLNVYDALIIHWSLTLITTAHLPESYIPLKDQQKIRKYSGLKILFIQDEYRRVNYICDKINYLKINLLFSCTPLNIATEIYKSLKPDIQIYETLTGYLPENINFKTKPHLDREIDVFYRGRKLPFWLGSFAQEKYLIGVKFKRYSVDTDLKIDISSDEKCRIYGKEWIDTLNNSRTTLGTESGASIVDYTGDIERDIAIHKYYKPQDKFKDLGHLISTDNKLSIKVISPRIFEAISTKTTLVLFPGNYSNILSEGDHFIKLEKNFSNFDQVIDKIKDKQYTERIANKAYEYVYGSGKFTYKAFIQDFEKKVLSHI